MNKWEEHIRLETIGTKPRFRRGRGQPLGYDVLSEKPYKDRSERFGLQTNKRCLSKLSVESEPEDRSL
jgi:hypothetical protein